MNKTHLLMQVTGAFLLAICLDAVCYPQNSLNSPPALTGSVEGTITLGDGTPCVHCTVMVFIGFGPEIHGTPEQTTTDEKGGYLLAGVPYKGFSVAFEHPVTHTWLRSIALFRPGKTKYDFDLSRPIEANAQHEVVGTARHGAGVDGSPCANCAVLIRPVIQNYGVYTDSRGDFRYLNLEPGLYEFTVRTPTGGTTSEFHYVDKNQPATVKLRVSERDAPTVIFGVDDDDKKSRLLIYELSPEEGQKLTKAQSSPGSQEMPTEAEAALTPEQAINSIRNGPHASMPPAQTTGTIVGSGTNMVITNNTPYMLWVYFTGPMSKTVQIAAHGSQSVSLNSGSYQVGARVSDPSVVPFYGEHNYGSGTQYSETFYIGTQQ